MVHDYKVGVMTYDLWASYRGIYCMGYWREERGARRREEERMVLSDICLTSLVG